MNVASLELCKELHEVSGWSDTPLVYGNFWRDGSISPVGVYSRDHLEDDSIPTIIHPVFDLGYLLSKLPQKITWRRETMGFCLTGATSDGSWICDYIVATWSYPLPDPVSNVWMHSGGEANKTEADTPEDAATKLAIQLFRQGLLTRDGESGASA
ncbi:hypothetical protein AB0280_17645 [Pseudarthrobacter sp902506025]|uniref:hypothetical protein n=1 Tax=Pseudarthrobacter sp. 902506025 TaxID=3155291 RepID=UPI0034505BAB